MSRGQYSTSPTNGAEVVALCDAIASSGLVRGVSSMTDAYEVLAEGRRYGAEPADALRLVRMTDAGPVAEYSLKRGGR